MITETCAYLVVEAPTPPICADSKLLNRKGYGRANLDLLRKRILAT
ncbi:hypothetical protein RMN57_01375 [Kitasatospora sp. CM 4170]|nr:hypothetical protein [Kitasatospora sp. CM 4170]WNM43449.1 hypothetical protein RMN57_01375 [Kitasatospora sp. CM 4170]